MNHQKLLVVTLLSIFTFSSISAMGLMQSTERVGSTGIIVKPIERSIPYTQGSPTPPPPEPIIELDIFTDPQCTKRMTTINWGELKAGDSSHKNIYIKNSGETKITLGMYTENWSSTQASDHMRLSWDYNGLLLQPNQVLNIDLELEIDQDCPELSQYGFDIIIIGY